MPDERALVAHVLRRTGFGPLPGQVDGAAGRGAAGLIDELLGAKPSALGATPSFDENNDDPAKWWLRRMTDPGAGLDEKLTWFLHGHLTTSYDKVGDWSMVWKQHLLLREHTRGNFRTLLRRVTVDPAMLVYLDGQGSTGDAPNENYGRELMELFSLGRGNYTEDDVRAGAKALAGWTVDWDTRKASFSEDDAYQGDVAFLGHHGRLRADDVIDAVCDHPACAPFVVGRLHRFFVGIEPDDARRAELAARFTESGLELGPVVEAILRHPSFLDRRMNRSRSPVEWVTAASAALGLTGNEHRDLAYDTSSSLGQLPFYPPNVAGWPPGPRWLSASHALTKAAVAVQSQAIDEIRDATDPVTAALERCSLYEVSASTRAALDRAAARVPSDPAGRAATLLGLAVSSPEFALA